MTRGKPIFHSPEANSAEVARSGLGARRWRLARFAAPLMACVTGATVALLLLTGQGSGDTLFQGIPDERIQVPLKLADSSASPKVSSSEAIAAAIQGGASFAAGSPQTVRETVLLFMEETRPGLPQNRLVWGVRFEDPAAASGGRYRFMGPDGNILHEAEFAIALVDATTGEYILTMEGWRRLDALPSGITPPPAPATSE